MAGDFISAPHYALNLELNSDNVQDTAGRSVGSSYRVGLGFDTTLGCKKHLEVFQGHVRIYTCKLLN